MFLKRVILAYLGIKIKLLKVLEVTLTACSADVDLIFERGKMKWRVRWIDLDWNGTKPAILCQTILLASE